MTDHNDADDSWHYTEDTLAMLSVSVAQIKSILSDGGESVSELTDSFVQLANTFQQLMDHKTSIENTDLGQIRHQIEQGIIAFQFYDRISQRLDHVSNSLQHMGNLIGDTTRRHKPEEWEEFQAIIQSKYTMSSERKLFEAILSGMPMEQALELVKKDSNNENQEDIELF
jgi:hypothetical protein